MYLAVDTGGTKTLVASLDDKGIIKQQEKFSTPENYNIFLQELASNVDRLSDKEFAGACIAIPGKLNRTHGTVLSLGNLPWKNEPIETDCEKIFRCPTLIENDANLAGLSEAMLRKEYDSVLYVTVSTGIGTGAVYKQRLNPQLIDSEGGHMMVFHNGKLEEWESFASGSAILRRYGKLAQDIHDSATWKKIARDLALGLQELIALIEPEAIVFGGSVGNYFDRFETPLKNELRKYETPLVKLPELLEAKRPDQAVIYGCYDLARQKFPGSR